MDIKSRNIKYSMGAKAAAVALIWLCFLSAVGSGIFLLYSKETAASKSYFTTYKATSEFERLVHNVVELNVKLISEESIKASSQQESVEADKLDRLRRIQDRLSNTVNFIYYIKNSKTGETITNITAAEPMALINKQSLYVYYSQWKTDSSYSILRDEINQMLLGTPYEVSAAVFEPLKAGDVFYDDFMAYSKAKAMLSYAYVLLVTSIILLILAAIYLTYVAGRKEKDGEVVLSYVDRIYADVHTMLVLIAAYLSIAIGLRGFHPGDSISWIILSIVLSIDVFIGISYVLSMIRQIKSGILVKNTLLITAFKGTKAFAKLCFGGKLFRASVLLILLGYGLINGILFDYGVDINQGDQSPIISGLILVFNAAAVYFTAKSLLSLSQIMRAVKEISSGNLDYTLNNSEISVTFLGLAEDLKNIQGGLKKAVAEAVKGERMKTELITNVSHDLKTPLTSIVNYVDLLKNEDLENQKADEYVSILEEKSARLKQLIEDLVEASKASSGNLNVNAEKVDLHELVMQASGEYEEKVKKAELDIRINAEEKNIYVYADGKQMWRIIENLLSNAIKYSMPHSRVYINLSKNDKYGSLMIKNISAYPLDIPPEQLTERFVRGDVSRTTEGSGLGLSIAQSLAHLQGGSFKIGIDGDLFKVNLEIPLWEEAEILSNKL